MGFEVFNRQENYRGKVPFARFVGDTLQLNKAGVLALGDASRVVFLVDRGTRTVRIRKAGEDDLQAFKPYRRQDGTLLSIGMYTFVKEFQPADHVRLPVTLIEGMLQFEMDAPRK